MRVLGFEPTYVPGQSYAPQFGVLLCLGLGPASAPEAVPTMMARAIAILVNMVVFPRWVATHTVLVCVFVT